MTLESFVLMTNIQAVCVTACGNFGIAGSSTGQIKMWNMQSGQERKTFYLNGAPAPKAKGNKGRSKTLVPRQTITGLVTDSLNRILIASTLDGVLHVGQSLPSTA
jgi:U3 small nucleolar RNA-associated protein 21